jgi:hypothetical protein
MMKRVALGGFVAAVVMASAGFSSAASAAVVSSSAASSAATVEKVVRDMQAHQIKYDQGTGSHAAPEVVAADASALVADQKSLKALTGKE